MRLCLQAWKAKGLLFSLSDEGVNAHHVPAFKLACQAGRSRGANHFAFDESRAMLVRCRQAAPHPVPLQW